MSEPHGFTTEERRLIDKYLPEMRQLKRSMSLRLRTRESKTNISMSVGAALRLRVSRELIKKNSEYYNDFSNPQALYYVTTLDSVSVFLLATRNSTPNYSTAFESLF